MNNVDLYDHRCTEKTCCYHGQVTTARQCGCHKPREQMLIDAINSKKGEHIADREMVAEFMIRNGFATGHGDTIEDLLRELEWQLKQREERIAP